MENECNRNTHTNKNIQTIKKFHEFNTTLHERHTKTSKDRFNTKTTAENYKQNETLDWIMEFTTVFHQILKLVLEITEKSHFNQSLEQSLVSDATTFGLGAAIVQLTEKVSVEKAYASRFLISQEEKYSVN